MSLTKSKRQRYRFLGFILFLTLSIGFLFQNCGFKLARSPDLVAPHTVDPGTPTSPATPTSPGAGNDLTAGEGLFRYNAATGAWIFSAAKGDGTFKYIQGLWAPQWTVRTGDFNGDGITDLLLYNKINGSCFQVLVSATGDFTYYPTTWAVGWEPYIAKLNGDTFDDVFLYNPVTGMGTQAITDGKGGFSVYPGAVQWAPGLQVRIVQTNADAFDDLFLYDPIKGTETTVTTDGNGGYSYQNNAWSAGWTFTALDLNGDGFADVHLYNKTNGSSSQGLRDASGNFTFYNTAWGSGWNVYAADMGSSQGDGLFLFNPTSARGISVLYDQNTRQPNYVTDFIFSGMAGADVQPLNLYGGTSQDLFFYNKANGDWSVYAGKGNGTFTAGAPDKSGTWSAGWDVIQMVPAPYAPKWQPSDNDFVVGSFYFLPGFNDPATRYAELAKGDFDLEVTASTNTPDLVSTKSNCTAELAAADKSHVRALITQAYLWYADFNSSLPGTFIDQAEANRPVLLKALQDCTANHPSFWGIYSADEPALNSHPGTESEDATYINDLKTLYSDVKNSMPQSHVLVTHAAKGAANFLAEYTFGDYVSSDIYLDYPYGCYSSDPTNPNFDGLPSGSACDDVVPGLYADKMKQVAPGKPVWMVLQAFNTSRDLNMPSYLPLPNTADPDFSRLETFAYAAITHGATGIIWWGLLPWYTDLTTQSQIYLDVVKVNKELRGIKPILSAPVANLAVDINPGPPWVSQIVKNYNGSFYVILQSNSAVPLSVAFNFIPVLATAKQVQDVRFGTVKTLSSGTLNETLEKFGVRVYKVE